MEEQKNKTKGYVLKCNKRYEERHGITKVRVCENLRDVLTNGTFGNTQIESSANLYDILVEHGLVDNKRA